MKRYTKYLFVFLALTFGLSLPAMAGQGAGAYKLDGAWVAKVVGVPGQWTYIISADPSGKRAAGYGSIDSGLNVDALFPGCRQRSEDRDAHRLLLLDMVRAQGTWAVESGNERDRFDWRGHG